MMKFLNKIGLIVVMVASVALSACGGGGGGSNPPTPGKGTVTVHNAGVVPAQIGKS
jgi:hypothetical protein